MDKARGTGRTSELMRMAPPGAVYVWCQRGSLDWAKELAGSLGRDDLDVISPDYLDKGYLVGRAMSAVVLDHASGLTRRQQGELDRWVDEDWS